MTKKLVMLFAIASVTAIAPTSASAVARAGAPTMMVGAYATHAAKLAHAPCYMSLRTGLCY